MASVKDIVEAQKTIIHLSWEADDLKCDSYLGGMLSGGHLKDNNTKLFKNGPAAVLNPKQQRLMNVS